MHWRAIIRLFGLLLMLYSLSFLPSLAVALVYQDGQWSVFLESLAATLSAGLLLWLPNSHRESELSVRDGFLIVALFWALLGVFGALPFILGLHLSLTDAVFESISGFTTTGATVIAGLDRLPPSILYHRQQIQWLGGMGVIVLAVAVLPLLGVGGMQLYRAEASGVAKHEKPTPRIGETARVLWSLYFGLTAACALAFWLAGMTLFDAVGHAFATVATGGFSTHDASLGHYDSPLIEAIAIVFMLAGAVNFAIHFVAWRDLDVRAYLNDPETRVFGLTILGGSLFIAASLYWAQAYADVGSSLRHGTFQVVSIMTSTGFGTATFGDWPLHIPLVLVILSFTGGCGGSTAGGLKVLRVMLLVKLGVRQLFQFAHPRAVLEVKIGRRVIKEDVLLSVWGFYVLYIATCLLLTVAMMAAGLDLESAFGAVFTTVNLCGPGLGEVAVTFATVDPVVKWLGVFGMLAGRLEIFTLLILFMPAFWRQ
ncbi:potassium transporter TrkG [Allochromatium vinosum]|uniref:Trk system potassium uptake protein n=1 Tax=Allochromatium vinosum (strain ATCC 17899 / DSM 180 / NBRC 103801 / NCIMB 10441 / D) TaxID=572477 RepID=D3RUV0_ALLVD|nr:potassium transporter TrkG [Allochromatium vinosum]ADC60999.1 potassium uptake protein, TrkH family [Allochromatium vinosum DSM 180]MBK1655059.1 potassium transporter [Allochromatium vinosum]